MVGFVANPIANRQLCMPETRGALTGESSPQVTIPADARVMLWMPSKHMGNLLVALKAIAAIEQQLRDNPRHLVVDEAYRDIVEAAGLESRPVFFPRGRLKQQGLWGQAATGLKFLREIRRCRPAFSIAVEGEQISQHFVPLSGSKWTIGPDNRFCKGFGHRVALEHAETHKFFDFQAIARAITGEAISPGYPPLRAPPAALERVDALLEGECDRGEPIAVLHPGATKDYKQWPVSAFAEIARVLHNRGMTVVVTGAGRRDGETIERLATEVSAPFVNLHDRLSLGALMALFQRARLFLGNDTGPTHLAAACGLPTFAIFGPSNDALWAPLGDNARTLRSATPCHPDCSTKQCFAAYRCMHSLTPDDVLARMSEALPRRAGAGSRG